MRAAGLANVRCEAADLYALAFEPSASLATALERAGLTVDRVEVLPGLIPVTYLDGRFG